jgi:hypothetical protein
MLASALGVNGTKVCYRCASPYGETQNESAYEEGSMKNTPLTLAQKRENRRTGKEGGLSRARSLTKARRLEIATGASHAAAKARTRAAKARRS